MASIQPKRTDHVSFGSFMPSGDHKVRVKAGATVGVKVSPNQQLISVRAHHKLGVAVVDQRTDGLEQTLTLVNGAKSDKDVFIHIDATPHTEVDIRIYDFSPQQLWDDV